MPVPALARLEGLDAILDQRFNERGDARVKRRFGGHAVPFDVVAGGPSTSSGLAEQQRG
jgi:hypothetical protein